MLSEMTMQELRQLPMKDLQMELRKAQSSKERLSLAVKTSQEKNSAKYQKAKQYVAQIHTVFSEITLLAA